MEVSKREQVIAARTYGLSGSLIGLLALSQAPDSHPFFSLLNTVTYLLGILAGGLSGFISFKIAKKFQMPYKKKALTVGFLIGTSTGALLVFIIGELVKQLQQ
jgi:hypothetical protein